MTRTDIPARLDRLPWSRWHWRVVIALGVAWVLDGLEVTLVGSIGGVLERPDTLGLSAAQIGWTGSLYIGGAVIGALVFGRLADRLGRKKLFLVTLAVYAAATLATAFSPNFVFFALCRFVTGLGIGGEYAAINSAIDELIPARVRGRVNLAINGSFWIGAALGAGLSLVLLDPRVLGPVWGWRAGFALGARAGGGDPAGAARRAREPALADRARPRRRGRAHRAAHRGRGAARSTGRCRRSSAQRELRRAAPVPAGAKSPHVLLQRYRGAARWRWR